MKDFLKNFVLVLKIFGEILAAFVLLLIPIVSGLLLIAGMMAWFDKLFGAVISVLLTLFICVLLLAIVLSLLETIDKRKKEAKLRETISEYVDKALEKTDNTPKN